MFSFSYKFKGLIYGETGSGKTTVMDHVATFMQDNDMLGTMHIIDTEGDAEEQFEGLDNVRIYDCESWSEFCSNVELAMEQVRYDQDHDPENLRQDFIVIDRLDRAWAELFADHYCLNVLGRDPSTMREDFTKVQAKLEAAGENTGGWFLFKYSRDMSDIYRAWERKLVKGTPCHLFCLSGTKEVITEGLFADPAAMRIEYREAGGQRPDGHKKSGHNFNIQLFLLTRRGADAHLLTTLRERRRTIKHGLEVPAKGHPTKSESPTTGSLSPCSTLAMDLFPVRPSTRLNTLIFSTLTAL